MHLGTPGARRCRSVGRAAEVAHRGRRRGPPTLVVVATGAHAVRPPGWEAALTLHTAADAQRLRERAGARARGSWSSAPAGSAPRSRGVAAAAGVDVVVARGRRRAPVRRARGERRRARRALVRRRRRAAAHRRARGRGGHQRRAAGGRQAASRPTSSWPRSAPRPTTDWLAGALPREADGSLRVDERYAVLGAPRSVRAVGDVALRRSRRHGWVPGGHWDGALRGPGGARRRPARHAAGPPSTSRPTSSPPSSGTSSRCSGCRAPDDEVVLRGDPAGDGWAALWFRRGADEVAAILTVDRPRDVGAARRLFAGARLPRARPRRCARDARDARCARARPLRARAPSVREVARARQVERHAGGRRRGDDLLVADRAARLHDGPHAGVDEHLQRRRRTGRTRPTPRRRRAPARRRPVLARSTASRHESTRLTCPIPTPTDAPSSASRIAFDFTARTARHANARSRSVASSAGAPDASVQVAGSSPGASTWSTLLHQQAAADGAALGRARPRPA